MPTTVTAKLPSGGLVTPAGLLRRWHWNNHAQPASQALVCKPEAWYLVRAQSEAAPSAGLLVEFGEGDGPVTHRFVSLTALGESTGDQRVGWVQAPAPATRMRVRLHSTRAFDHLTLHPVAERDPKCHPAASVPRWTTYRTPFPIDAVVLPESLAGLAGEISHAAVETLATPRSLRDLAAHVIGKAWVLDPAWVDALRITWRDLEKVAGGSWAVVDLATTARLVREAGLADAQVAIRRSDHGLMSARVEYADAATCGFALMDVMPFGTWVEKSAVPSARRDRAAGAARREPRPPGPGFSARVLRANRSWKRYAEESAFAMLLSSQTDREDCCNDVVSATRAVGQGEIVATDLPWLAAGRFGPLVAPRVVRQLLRTHLGAGVDERVQFWNRWDDTRVVIRDIADLARRYAPLQPVRFASENGARGMVRLGLALEDETRKGAKLAKEEAAKKFVIQTGRIDLRDAHDGLPPEPMMIFMKWLAREVRERTPLAREALRGARIVWQFDAADGMKYATLFEAAEREAATAVLRLTRECIPVQLGILGDGSHEFQAALTERIVAWMQRQTARL